MDENSVHNRDHRPLCYHRVAISARTDKVPHSPSGKRERQARCPTSQRAVASCTSDFLCHSLIWHKKAYSPPRKTPPAAEVIHSVTHSIHCYVLDTSACCSLWYKALYVLKASVREGVVHRVLSAVATSKMERISIPMDRRPCCTRPLDIIGSQQRCRYPVKDDSCNANKLPHIRTPAAGGYVNAIRLDRIVTSHHYAGSMSIFVTAPAPPRKRW